MLGKKTLKILIAGGGIGGITALLALRQRGIAAELFEQAPAFGQVGAGIQVSCNATRILRALGLGDALARVTYYPEGRDYRAWDSGERLYYTPLGQRAEKHFGAPYYTAYRADLLDVLLSGLGKDGFHLNARIERFDQDADGVTLTLADGRIAAGDILIGADGIHSTVRGQMFGKELPRYTGNVAWRGLVPAERVAHLDVAPRHRRLDGTEPQHRPVLCCGGARVQLDRHQPLGAAGAGILAGRGTRRGCAGRILRLARYHPHDHHGDAEAAAPGALRPRAAAGLAGRAGGSPW